MSEVARVIPLVPCHPRPPKPPWLKVRAPGSAGYLRLKGLMRDLDLHTVCEEAQCPNIGECWHYGTATFMILGDVCTRACSYCAVAHGRRHNTSRRACRSEEHTSELQSRLHLVCRLLLEKKKTEHHIAFGIDQCKEMTDDLDHRFDCVSQKLKKVDQTGAFEYLLHAGNRIKDVSHVDFWV